MTIGQEIRIKELEKQVEKLSFVRGISDEYGSYKSLQKDAEIIMFFLSEEQCKRRYCELINNFTDSGWGKSTVEAHLRNLTKRKILEKTSLPGEYTLSYDMSRDVDMLLRYLVGDSIYKLAKKSWEKRDLRY